MKIETDEQYQAALVEMEKLMSTPDVCAQRIQELCDEIEAYEEPMFPASQRLKRVSIAVACARNNVIGKDGKLPWNCPDDLEWFKRFTMGKTVIMGRGTWDSLPVKPLPGRLNIVVTNRQIEGVLCATSVEQAIKLSGTSETVVIGGAQIYEQAMPYVDTIYVSGIPVTVAEPNTKFPAIGDCWEKTPLANFDTFNLVKFERKE